MHVCMYVCIYVIYVHTYVLVDIYPFFLDVYVIGVQGKWVLSCRGPGRVGTSCAAMVGAIYIHIYICIYHKYKRVCNAKCAINESISYAGGASITQLIYMRGRP
jgi:hypothetical protein